MDPDLDAFEAGKNLAAATRATAEGDDPDYKAMTELDWSSEENLIKSFARKLDADKDWKRAMQNLIFPQI